jgi:hypothetical protein
MATDSDLFDNLRLKLRRGCLVLAGGAPVLRLVGWTVRWPGLALPILTQIVVLTVGFIGVEGWKGRWQTILGIVVWSIGTVWWALVPRYPVLLQAT